MPRKYPSQQVRQRDNYKARYGLYPSDVAKILERQGGVCGICRTTPKRPVVDHCHKTNRVRGILCHKCNIFLSAIERDGFVAMAFEYLAAYGAVGGPSAP